jgi:alkylation response protein AidB-like acyl-CoA dehydrogenase
MNRMTQARSQDGASACAIDLSDLLTEIRKRRNEFSGQQYVSPDIIERLRALGLYRAIVARTFGGEERTPTAFCKIIETISTADGSVGWVASFGAAATYLAGLPEATLREIYANGPDVVFAGAMFPTQQAEKIPGGVRVTGRWPFGSGSMGAALIGVGITIEADDTGGLPRVAIMPADKVRIVHNWDVIGLQGTGSHDIVVDGVEVPDEWTLIRGAGPKVDAPIYNYPTLAFAAQVLAVVGLGIARGALDEVTAMSVGRDSITGAPPAADRPYVQSGIAEAEARLRSARAFFYEATETVWADIVTGRKAPVQSVALLRLAATHAARTGAEVTRAAFGLTGTAAIYTGHKLALALSDAAVVAQHAFLGEGTIQSAGRALLGMPTPPGFP